MIDVLRGAFYVLHKDLLVEFRHKEISVIMLIFSVLMTVLFNFVSPLDTSSKVYYIGGFYWLSLIFASNVGVYRLINNERVNSCHQSLLMLPFDRVFIVIGKTLSAFIITFAIGLILIPLLGIFSDVDLLNDKFGYFLLEVVFGCFGIALSTVFFSYIALGSGAKEMLLPVLQIPVLTPLILGLSSVTTGAFVPDGIVDIKWVVLSGGFDVVFFGVVLVLFDILVETD